MTIVLLRTCLNCSSSHDNSFRRTHTDRVSTHTFPGAFKRVDSDVLFSIVAEGIIEAVEANKIKKPIIVRVLGTGAERAKKLVRLNTIDSEKSMLTW
jgi:hypothetical protein